MRSKERMECLGGVMSEDEVYMESGPGAHESDSSKDLGFFKRTTKDTSFGGFEMCCVEDVVCWNAMIDGYVKYSEMELAKLVFERMVCRDVVSWNTMINGYTLVGSIKQAKRLFNEMPERNVVYWNFMLAGYVKCGDVEGAHGIFYKMPRRGVVSWNAMLACYACALDQGASLHAYISEHKIGLTTIVGMALVDMYARCGSISLATEVFYSIELKDVLTWNTIIIGMAMHGHLCEALRLFKEMQEVVYVPMT
ncbi:hypothetical protein IFM89_024095 [Coptis chinensis]|uniref:Pentatricopeptide repeat-containing protein n=1 Tax=Coptis chinensis TaxID=261450 RepID=A0A835IF96_9MAGN|nr:hypothetical protein IFM89_024095 [Coptis chinensis]